MVAGCVNDSIPEPVENEIQVRVDYEGSWSGKVELQDSLTAFDGSGTEIFDMPGEQGWYQQFSKKKMTDQEN